MIARPQSTAHVSRSTETRPSRMRVSATTAMIVVPDRRCHIGRMVDHGVQRFHGRTGQERDLEIQRHDGCGRVQAGGHVAVGSRDIAGPIKQVTVGHEDLARGSRFRRVNGGYRRPICEPTGRLRGTCAPLETLKAPGDTARLGLTDRSTVPRAGPTARFPQLVAAAAWSRPAGPGANARIGSAATQVAVHDRCDVRVGRIGRVRRQGRRQHDLTGLTETTLRDVKFCPCRTQRLALGRGRTLDRRGFAHRPTRRPGPGNPARRDRSHARCTRRRRPPRIRISCRRARPRPATSTTVEYRVQY